MELVELELETGGSVLIPLVRTDPEEEVGLSHMKVRLDSLVDQLKPMVEQLHASLSTVTPDKLTVTLSVGVAWDAGMIKSIVGGPGANLGIEVSVEWTGQDA